MELGVLFCDQVGSTALLNRLGDALADEVRRDIFLLLEQAARVSRGQVVKGSGDGLMVVFPSGAADALLCAELMLRKIDRLASRELCQDVAFKVGVSYGDAIFDSDDWYGAAVNLAARLCAAAEAGQILATAATVDAAGVDDGEWSGQEPRAFKGFPDLTPVRGRHPIPDRTSTRPTPAELDFWRTTARRSPVAAGHLGLGVREGRVRKLARPYPNRCRR